MRRKIDALAGGVMCSGAKIPSGWAAALFQEAFDTRVTRAMLIRNIVAAWLKKHPEYTSVEQAAEAHNRSFGQQFRQVLEDEVPHLCPPIQEWRSNGAAWAKAIRDGRAKRKMVSTMDVTLPSYVELFLRRVARAKPETYPSVESLMEDIVTRWATKQLERIEQRGAVETAPGHG